MILVKNVDREVQDYSIMPEYCVALCTIEVEMEKGRVSGIFPLISHLGTVYMRISDVTDYYNYAGHLQGLIALAVLSVSASQCAVYPLFAHGEMFGDMVIEDGDTENVLVELNQTFRFYGKSYHAVRVYVKGFLSFGKGTDDFSQPLLTKDEPLISIFFSDVNLNIDDIGKVLYRKVNLEEERQLIETIQRNTADYGVSMNPELVFIVTWKDVSSKMYPKSMQIANGYGLQEHSHNPKWFKYPSIFSYKDSSVPGRALQRVDEETIKPGSITVVRCTSCRIDLKKGEVRTFDDNKDVHIILSNRKYLMSKGYRADADKWRDPCKYMWKVITDDNGHISSASFSVGLHPANKKKYKRNFVFRRISVSSVEGRGHNRKPMSLSLPYTEAISKDGEENITVLVEKSPFGWKVSSRVCQYMFIYNPLDTYNQIRLILSLQYKHSTLGLCQNNNGNRADEHNTCTKSLTPDNPFMVIRTCSCPKRNKACLKALNVFDASDE
ncbi:hypothetical protein LSH36_1143g00042 [Paralvinella palmiformis]|uniref:NIDO domain-containing protein n=1 Tax=Paralvinella palmiformis TaxID=53620 RepID=A0AAD9IVP6_9ANNE|nr:hypothetical protein LSH36_1143g00042 [Paralvinella palmiformis]